MASDQLRGDFAAFLNRDKQPGDKRPIFEGHVCKPGDDDKYQLTLWAHDFTDQQTGEVKSMYSGTVSAFGKDAEPADQVSALTRTDTPAEKSLGGMSLRPRQVTLFPNSFKDDVPDKKRPDLWGGINFGDGSPLVRLSVWMQQTRNGQAMLSGASSFPLPGKSESEMQDAAPELAEMVAKGTVSKGVPKKGKGGRAD